MTAATQQTSRWLWLAIVLSYLVSLPLPAVYRHGFGAPTSGIPGSVVPGYEMLGSLPFALLAPSWWANPAWLFGVVALFRRELTWAWYCGLVGTFLALLALLIGPFPPNNFNISHFHIGFYVWLGSMLALLATAHREITMRKRLDKCDDLEGIKSSTFVICHSTPRQAAPFNAQSLPTLRDADRSAATLIQTEGMEKLVG